MAYSRIYRSIFTGRPASALLRSQNVNSTLCKQIPQFSRGFRATNASQQRYRQYSRFQQSRNFLYRWSQSPNFYYQVGGGGLAIGSVYVYNLEDVPVSGRRRFNFIRPEWEKSFGEEMYNQAIQENRGKILSEWDPRTRMVQRVLDRLIPSSGIDGEQWEVHVVKDEEPNAFVIPGGKVFVNTGILRICKNDDGLATVLGHEIAHNVAHHAAERMSQAGILTLLGLVLYATLQIDVGVFRLLGSFVFEMPGSRKQEVSPCIRMRSCTVLIDIFKAEADYIGLSALSLMIPTCYFHVLTSSQ